jgi:serine/threonine protein kinase
MPRRKADELPDNHGPLWTDISVSETEPLPKLSKTTTTSNPLFLAKSHHSHVYTIDITEHNETRRAILKLFPKATKRLYVKEVEAYRFLSHYGVVKEGVVPKIFGILPTISQRRLDVLLKDSIPENAPIALPASGLVMEFIEAAVSPTRENMTPAIAWDALEGLRLIHKAHILHQDTEARNLLIRPSTGEAIWFDFSSARINRMILLALQERQHAKQILFRTLVCPVL